jgi:peptidoglycan/LPS O-acetylase OafA/YrhL
MKSDSPRSLIRPHYAAFNGIRGLAVLMVFYTHYGGLFGYPGLLANLTWTGVDLFFVLSGFLITGILYDSLDDPHFFRNFYIRRSLRVFPLFYGFFLLLFILTPILHLGYGRDILQWMFYVGNLTLPFANTSVHNPTVITMMHHGWAHEVINVGPLWSLCVEEQFYLIWPAVVWFLRDRKKLMRVCVAVAVFVLIGRLCIEAYVPRSRAVGVLYYSTYTRCDTLLVGSWLALFLRGRQLTIKQVRVASIWLISGSVALLTFGFRNWTTYVFIFSPYTQTVGYSLVALAAAGLLLLCLDESSLVSRFFTLWPFASLGAISYGFYFFHRMPYGIWARISDVHPQFNVAIPFMAFGVTLVIAKVSFHYFESPFLRLKKVLAPQRAKKVNGSTSPLSFHVSEPKPDSPN